MEEFFLGKRLYCRAFLGYTRKRADLRRMVE